MNQDEKKLCPECGGEYTLLYEYGTRTLACYYCGHCEPYQEPEKQEEER